MNTTSAQHVGWDDNPSIGIVGSGVKAGIVIPANPKPRHPLQKDQGFVSSFAGTAVPRH
jgi:hypothetical protein